MKNRIKVIEYHKLSSKNIFVINLIDGYFNVDDTYENDILSFKIKGVGMENIPNEENISILVEIKNENYSLEDFKNKIFSKK